MDHYERISWEPRLRNITEESLAAALDGFPLSPKQGMAWLTLAVRSALWVGLTPPGEGAERQPNKETQAELFALAESASKLWLALQNRTQPADNALMDYAYRGWQKPEEWTLPPDYEEFSETVRRLDGFSVFLRRAAMMLEVQRPNWKLAEQREERIWQAQCLSVIYHLAFEKEPTVNNWETAKSFGPWWDFYSRVIDLAFKKNVLNPKAVLKEARRRDKANRVRFGPGIIPDALP